MEYYRYRIDRGHNVRVDVRSSTGRVMYKDEANNNMWYWVDSGLMVED